MTINTYYILLAGCLYTFLVDDDAVTVDCMVDATGDIVWSSTVPVNTARDMFSSLVKMGGLRVQENPQCSDCGSYGHTECMKDVVQP